MTGEHLYALLLRLYPKAFRRRYGISMTETFADLYTSAPSTGVRFWFFVVSDTCRAASSQHFHQWTSRERRIAYRWLLACACGAVLCYVVGTTIVWSYRYLYHPFLERFRFVPSLYGAFLGVTLATVQSLVFPPGTRRLGWVALNAIAAGAGMEIAAQMAPSIGPLAGAVVGAFVALTQWLALRGRMQRPGAAVFPSAVTIAAAIIGGTFALTRVLSGFDALRLPTSRWMNAAFLQALSAPMTWGDCALAVATTVVAGLFLGALTMNPASSLLSRAH